MPVDFNSTSDIDPTRVESDTPLFAPIRTSRKGQRGTFFANLPDTTEPEARTRPAERRAFAETTAPAQVVAPSEGVTTPPTGGVVNEEPAFAPTTAFATTTRRTNSAAPALIAGGLVLLAGVATAGWYLSQPHNQGVAQLTPGAPVNDTAAPAQVDEVAQTTPPSIEPTRAPSVQAPPTATARAEPPTRPFRVARARTGSPAAADQGVNASAVAPAQRPMTLTPPVSPTPPQAAPAPAPLTVTPPPADAPLPTQTAPTPAPETQAPPPSEVPPQ